MAHYFESQSPSAPNWSYIPQASRAYSSRGCPPSKLPPIRSSLTWEVRQDITEFVEEIPRFTNRTRPCLRVSVNGLSESLQQMSLVLWAWGYLRASVTYDCVHIPHSAGFHYAYLSLMWSMHIYCTLIYVGIEQFPRVTLFPASKAVISIDSGYDGALQPEYWK